MTLSIHLPLKALLLALIIAPILFFTSGQSFAQGFYGTWEDADKFIVFLDPGHGGRDLGSRGVTSMLEKNINLKLANLIKKRLSHDERIDVRSSRIDDVDLGAVERIDMANSVKANLFVGIHTDGGGTPRSHPMKIFIWGKEVDFEADENAESTDKQGDKAEWSNLNENKSEKSQELSEAMEERLRQIDPKRGVDIVTTDRMLIGGLTMPAMIVEPIDLANPQDEIKLQDMKYLRVIANAMTDAIYDYLKSSTNWER